jgi:biopolymer transport protein ExbD
VLFLLLIFFMVSSTFIEKPAIELSLPKAKTSELKRTDEIIISLDKEGNMFLDGIKIQPDQLSTKLGGFQLKKKQGQIILEADENVAYKTVVFVMDTARDLGFTNIVALTTSVNE